MKHDSSPYDEDWDAVYRRNGLTPPPPDDSLVVAAAAVAAIPAAPTVQAHLLSAEPPKPGSWACRDGRSPAKPGRVHGYLSELDGQLVGKDGRRVVEFLDWLLVRTQILSFRRLDDETRNGFRAYLPGSVVRVEGGGDHRRVICPFHAERSPSMVFSLTSRSWHCYGCGAHRTHVGLAASLLVLPDREAADLLRRSVGMPRPPWQLTAPRRSRALRVFGWALGDRPNVDK